MTNLSYQQITQHLKSVTWKKTAQKTAEADITGKAPEVAQAVLQLCEGRSDDATSTVETIDGKQIARVTGAAGLTLLRQHSVTLGVSGNVSYFPSAAISY